MKKIEDIRKKAAPIFAEYRVINASLFGSTARGKDKPGSDLDFLVEFPKDYGGFFVMARLKRSLEKSFRKKVDLLTYRSVNPRIRDNVMRDAIKVYGKK